jgi:Ran GTPase-activating protein (RanGAP) involved in mRNA processing and transport
VVETLNLQANGISDAGATGLADALQLTASLRSVDLWGNHIRHRGALALADALAASFTETPVQQIRLDECWLPVQRLFGTRPEDSVSESVTESE